jgi:hypothetical protein
MSILGLRILPPFAIGRFGSSDEPLEAFELEQPATAPLDYRRIVPTDSLEIDQASGKILRKYRPEHIRFKEDDGRIRPVAPFLEVYAQTGPDALEPLTQRLLDDERLDASAVRWKVEVGNLKVFRQTGNNDDKVIACLKEFSDHDSHELRGESRNFLTDKYIPFGSVRYICPTKEFPEIRLRFTPAAGKVYGANLQRFDQESKLLVDDPVFKGHEDRIVYDEARGSWRGFQIDPNSSTLPNPSDIYQGYLPAPDSPAAKSWGYLDDVCDGWVSVELRTKDGRDLQARAWISACMPAFAPDSQPIRTVADELEQLMFGPEIDDGEVSVEDAAKILLRALETVRHMNTLAMNGNIIDGRVNIAHTLITQDTNDFGRQFAPIMTPSLVDNFAVRTLHERVLTALLSGSAPWFAEVLRRPEEIGDMSDKGRRKMPAMLRGADGRAVTLTWRQISKIVKAATQNLYKG